MTLFTATLARAYPRSPALTKGKTYDVIDFNEYFGTYLILDDAGQRTNLDWLSFADQGKASTEYQCRHEA